MVLVFIPSFIMSLYNALEEILNSKRKWRVFLLIFFSFLYLPIYYTKYVSSEEKYLGIIIISTKSAKRINKVIIILYLLSFSNVSI